MKLLPLLLILFAAPAFAATPQETVKEINAAIDSADAAAFQQLVDLDNILNQALETFLEEIRNPANAEQLPPMLTLMLSQAANKDSMRQLLLGQTRSFVLNGIASGAFAGRAPSATQEQGMLAPIFANASLGRKEITAIGDLAEDGEDLLLPFTVRDYGNGMDYEVVGRFAKSGAGNLQLKKVENMPAIFAQIRAEMEAAQ